MTRFRVRELTIGIPLAVSMLAGHPLGAQQAVYVTSRTTGTISIVDPTADSATVRAIGRPDFVVPEVIAARPGGSSLYVAGVNTAAAGVVAVFDIATSEVTTVVEISRDAEVAGIAFRPDGARAYVTSAADNTLTVVDASSNSISATIDLGCEPGNIALAPDGRRAYVTCAENGGPGAQMVMVIDTTTNTVAATVADLSALALGGIAVAPDGRTVYGTAVEDGIVFVLDTSTNSVVARIATGGSPGSVAFTPSGQFVYLTDGAAKVARVIDTTARAAVATIALPGGAGQIAMASDGSAAYVVQPDTCALAVIDTASRSVSATIPLIDGAAFLAVAAAPPPTPTPAATPTPQLTSSPGAPHLCAYVPLPDSGAVAVVDTTTSQATGIIPLSDALHVTVSPDGRRAYATGAVGHEGPGSIAVIDTATNVVIDTIVLGDTPSAVAVAPSGTPAYATYAQSACYTAAIIDTRTNTVTGSIPGSSNRVEGIAIAPDGTTAYIAESNPQVLAVIDLASNTVAAEIPVVAGPADESNGPVAVAITPSGAFVYVVVPSIFADQPSPVVVVDTKTHTVATTLLAGNSPVAVSITPDGRFAYVANSQSGSISVIDTTSNLVSSTVIVGGVPIATAFSPDGTRAYVANFTANAVDVIDTAAQRLIGSIPVAGSPNDVAVALEPGECTVPPTATPIPTATPTPSVTPTPTLTPTATGSPSPTRTATATPSSTPTSTAARTSTPTASATWTVTPTIRPQNTATATSSVTAAAARNGSGCTIQRTRHDSARLLPLLLPLMLLWHGRWRSRTRAQRAGAAFTHRRRILSLQIVLVCSAGAVLFGAPRRVGSQVVSPQSGVGTSGSVIYLDGNGRPRIPNPDTQPPPRPHTAVNRAVPAGTPAIVPAPGGGQMMILDDRFRSNSGGEKAEPSAPAPRSLER